MDMPTASPTSRLPDLDVLRTFVVVCERSGFTRASVQLCRTQSTISLHIKRLEELYGCELLVRSKRKVHLTPEGEMLLGYAKRMLQLHDEVSAKLGGAEIEGTVRVGIPEDYATQQLPKVLRRFVATHPGVRVEVRCAVTAELMAALGNGDLDAVIARRGPNNQGGMLVWKEPVVWAGPRIEKRELERPLPLVLFPHGCVYRPLMMQVLEDANVSWSIMYTSTSLSGVQAAVVAGMGITATGLSTVTADMRIVEPTAAGLPELLPTELALFRSGKNDSAAVEAIVNHMLQSFSEPANLPSLKLAA